jgi:hypothetical protein
MMLKLCNRFTLLSPLPLPCCSATCDPSGPDDDGQGLWKALALGASSQHNSDYKFLWVNLSYHPSPSLPEGINKKFVVTIVLIAGAQGKCLPQSLPIIIGARRTTS